jgi:hypothetical protein
MRIYRCDKCRSDVQLQRLWVIKNEHVEFYFDLCKDCANLLRKVVEENIQV